MSKLTKAWIESQIEQELERGNNPEAVRDLAALWTVHQYMCRDEAHADSAPVAAYPAEYHHADRKVVHSAPAHDRLDKEAIMAWVSSMEDSDGVRGGKYSWHQAQQYALNKGITDEYRMLEMYAIMNAMYADYHKVAKKFGVDRDEFYACMAIAFIEDPDAVDDKVEEYYKHVVKHE